MKAMLCEFDEWDVAVKCKDCFPCHAKEDGSGWGGPRSEPSLQEVWDTTATIKLATSMFIDWKLLLFSKCLNSYFSQPLHSFIPHFMHSPSQPITHCQLSVCHPIRIKQQNILVQAEVEVRKRSTGLTFLERCNLENLENAKVAHLKEEAKKLVRNYGKAGWAPGQEFVCVVWGVWGQLLV